MSKTTVQNYQEAIKLIRKMCAKPVGSETPIKLTQFCGDHKVSDSLFQVLQKLKVIEPVVSAKREGTIFGWIYNQASNESDTHLAFRVQEFMSQKGKEYYKTWKKKNKEVPHIPPTIVSKSPEASRGLTIKAGADGVKVITKGPTEQVAIAHDVIEPEEPIVAPDPVQVEEQVQSPSQEANQTNSRPEPQSRHKSLSFQLEGAITKEDLIQKIQILLNDDTISSFKMDVQY
jgi:hypothetical protein